MSRPNLSNRPQPPSAARAGELRVRRRIACDAPASCQPVAARSSQDPGWTGKVRDVSSQGVGLILSRRFEPGTCLVIELPAPAPRAPETLFAQVEHATALAPVSWLIGCSFATELSEDELQRLLRLVPTPSSASKVPAAIDRLTAHTADGVRPSATSRQAALNSVVLPDVTLEAEVAAGKAATFSVRRLHMTGPWPPAPGTTLTVRGADRLGSPAEIRLRVNSCSQKAGRWTVNYSPADASSLEALQLLGLSGERL
jgi:hypothetical protein